MDFVAGDMFWFNATELVHCRRGPGLASSGSSLHSPFLPVSHCSLLPGYPWTSAPRPVAWTLMASPPFPDCHGQRASLWLDRSGQRRACAQRCWLHSLPACLETWLGHRRVFLTPNPQAFYCCSQRPEWTRSQGAEVTSEAPLTHEWPPSDGTSGDDRNVLSLCAVC